MTKRESKKTRLRLAWLAAAVLVMVFGGSALATRHIPTDNEIGTWDPISRTYTLTTDVYEGLEIKEDNLTLDGNGHTVTGSGTSGVLLREKQYVTIQNLNVQGFYYGIALGSSSNNTVIGNTTSNNDYGIYLAFSSNNALINNTANSNNNNGIFLWSSNRYNTLTGNTANSNTWRGISLTHSSNYNTLTGNTVSDNHWGVSIVYSWGNNIYTNNFIDNRQQAYVSGSSGNVFNLDKPIGGNYWNNWCPPQHPDTDGDGFVDSPFSSGGAQDNLPLVSLVVWPPPAPSWPDGSTLNAPDVSITSLTLTWTPAVPPYGVTEYQLFQDGVLIATVGGEVITYEVTGLESDTQYAFEVEACDAAGNCTADGPSVMVRTLTAVEATERLIDDVTALNLPKGFVGKLNDTIKVLTDANENNDGAACNKLNDFIDQVNSKADTISDAGGDPAALIADAEAIISTLNGT